MITTTLLLSHDRCNWTEIVKRPGVWSYQRILYEARDVLAYYREIGELVYTRVSYTHSTAGTTTIQLNGVYRPTTDYGEIIPELDAQAAIEEAERIIKGKTS